MRGLWCLRWKLYPQLETRGVVAEFRKADKTLTMWSSTQLPHVLRNYLAEQLGLLQYQLRVIAPEVGGGFGCKQDIYLRRGSGRLCRHANGPPGEMD